ncbi:alpha/beta fold hydrolase [Piscinibacter koreensis]|uniref:Alpha/beta hydrolase n=1 Tax=Piscinibacter koreensis TaxID=2742824 RepID=A0A7Y6NKY8_9BURK|nr:alpha/beta hydrolase [Schlegelella koreensis]NUZ05040.1 alpha/beta hydrolase [Schlegelella koreensis]
MLVNDSVLFRNNVRVGGNADGPTMVFAHGFGCDQNMWRFVQPAFATTHRTVLFDYVGCGKSDFAAFDALRYGSLDGYAHDLLDVADALDLDGAALVAHSVSSMIGLLATIRNPARFSKLVMVAPSPRYLNDGAYVGGFEHADIEGLLSLMDHNYIGWASYLAPVVMANPENPALTRELEASFCSTDPIAAKAFARATFFSDNRADLPKGQVPSLILQVRDDAVAPLSVGSYMREHLPNSELVVLDVTGHCPHMSHPEPTIDAIRDFLAQGNGAE